jgi:citrate lyase beta subunit
MRGVVRRSWPIVPCDDTAQIEQAVASAADVGVMDLMECVPEEAKAAARDAAKHWALQRAAVAQS